MSAKCHVGLHPVNIPQQAATPDFRLDKYFFLTQQTLEVKRNWKCVHDQDVWFQSVLLLRDNPVQVIHAYLPGASKITNEWNKSQQSTR